MRSINTYISSNERYYGKKFKYYDNSYDDLVYTITKFPDGYNLDFSDETHCWIKWNEGGWIGGVEYTWGILRKNIGEGVWILV